MFPHDRGAADRVPEHPRVLASQDGLALEATDRAVDGSAAILRLARADDRSGVILGLQQAGDDAHQLNILLTKTNAHERNAMANGGG